MPIPTAHELLRFHVPSSKGKAVYLVDLTCYGGNGKCDCPDFRCRHEPVLANGCERSDATRCKHIKAARSLFCDMNIDKILELYPNNDGT